MAVLYVQIAKGLLSSRLRCHVLESNVKQCSDSLNRKIRVEGMVYLHERTDLDL